MTDLRPLVDLPELNLWLALAWSGHRYHAIACRYWEEQAAHTVVFTTVTALGLVRLLSQPRVMGKPCSAWARPAPFRRPSLSSRGCDW